MLIITIIALVLAAIGWTAYLMNKEFYGNVIEGLYNGKYGLMMDEDGSIYAMESENE